MAVQDQVRGTCSNTVPSVGGYISPNAVNCVQLNEQFYSGEDHGPKVRKAYTITKQRERWTEDEHKKFIEALKLHGRAWRRIEEHVGTKTAVQIRSHAQKFFSKVVRESSGSNTSSVEPIEIPPPRPKRKPMHPYPRKLVDNCKKEMSVYEQPIGPMSPDLSMSERENQSPTSVLSAIGSDTLGAMDSSPSTEDNESQSPSLLKDGSVQNEQFPLKIELSQEDNVFAKEASVEDSSTRSIKLFGKIVLVPEDTHRPSSPTMEACKSQPLEITVGKPVQIQPWSQLPQGVQGGFYGVQSQSGSSNQAEAGSAALLPWWTVYGGIPFPSLLFNGAVSAKAHTESNLVEAQESEIKKEGSWTGSNTGSTNDEGNSDKTWDVETQSCQLNSEEEKQLDQVPKNQLLSEKSSFYGKRVSLHQGTRGFVPYKRCLGETDTHKSIVSDVEREKKRIRLCL